MVSLRVQGTHLCKNKLDMNAILSDDGVHTQTPPSRSLHNSQLKDNNIDDMKDSESDINDDKKDNKADLNSEMNNETDDEDTTNLCKVATNSIKQRKELES
jgi:hypothetical protein